LDTLIVIFLIVSILGNMVVGVGNAGWVEVSEHFSSEESSQPVSEEDGKGVPPVHLISLESASKDQASNSHGENNSWVQVRVSERGVNLYQEEKSHRDGQGSEEEISVSSGKNVHVHLLANHEHINLGSHNICKKDLHIRVNGLLKWVLNYGQIWYPVPGPN